MDSENMILANEFCAKHHIQVSLISKLHKNGLIEIVTIEETRYIPISQLSELEKIIRLYSELGINLEGIETIIHLLHRIDEMQHEVTALKNRLRLYEHVSY